MDIFSYRQAIITDYARYIHSFIHIRDERIGTYVRTRLNAGLLWPDPLIQVNPSYAPGETVDDLVGDGTLHPGCAEIFRAGRSPSESMRLYQHQTAAIRADHLRALLAVCDSELERRWLCFLEEKGLRLPSHAQHFIAECRIRADFFYQDQSTVVFVDGPPHDFDSVGERDQNQEICLEDAGYFVVRFYHGADWGRIVGENPSVFGKSK